MNRMMLSRALVTLAIFTGVAIVHAVQEQPTTYQVQPGESLWKIAEQVYGDGAKWTVIAEANGIDVANPRPLQVGEELIVPRLGAVPEVRNPIHPELPELVFRFVGRVMDEDADGSLPFRIFNVNMIEIQRDNEPQIFQTIQGLDTQTPFRDDDFVGFVVEDMNFDGYRDIRIVEFLPASPNVPYLYWLFDPEAGIFVRSMELEEITSSEFDADKKQIESTWRDGATRHGTNYYQWVDGKPVLVRQELEEYLEAGVYQLTIRERVGDEMKVVEQKVVREGSE